MPYSPNLAGPFIFATLSILPLAVGCTSSSELASVHTPASSAIAAGAASAGSSTQSQSQPQATVASTAPVSDSAEPCGVSPNYSVVTQAGSTLCDSSHDSWAITAAGTITKNGAAALYSANVIELAYVNGAIWQENSSHLWWTYSSGAWTPVNGTTVSPLSGATPSPSQTGNGGFSVSGGQIIGPNGSPFTARGMNLYDGLMGSASTILSLFPGVNMIRVNCFNYNSPSYYQAFINQMTAQGVVVELEDHTNTAGDAGGAQGVIYTGSLLTNELNWYSSLASAYAGNPYVWFGTDNEPTETDSNGNSDPAALSTWQQQTYQAIRNAGNQNMVMIEAQSNLTPSVYASMTGIILDYHYYGWVSNYSTNVSTVQQTFASQLQTYQLISANGVAPVIIGEYGPSTNGTTLDPNGMQVVSVVESSGYGNLAWAFNSESPQDDLTDGTNLLAPYGTTVAAWIASGAK